MLRFLFIFLAVPFLVKSQRIDIDVFGGMSNYQGDLRSEFFTLQNANGAWAVMLKVGITNTLYVRTGFSFCRLAAYDANNLQKNKPRNLDFETTLQEYSAGLEYRFFNPEKFSITPYIFAAAGAFHYDPYTYYNTGGKSEKVYLHPLSTEGEGLSMYPQRKPYSLTQFCIPYGAGIKWQVNCNLNVGIELRQTKTFTDYIDDVSNSYVDQTALRNARGQLAVDLAWRQDEYDGSPYPKDGSHRGNPDLGDLYYFFGITVGLKLNDCDNGSFSLGGLFNGEHSLFKRGGGGYGSPKHIKSQVGCPRF